MTSNRYRNQYIDGAACFWTSSIVNFVPALKSREAAKCLLRILDECRREFDVSLLGYVIMPNHFHLIVWAEDANRVRRFLDVALARSSAELRKIVESDALSGNPTAASWLRIFTSHAGKGKEFTFWKERGRAFPVTTGDGLREKLKYIHENPVRKDLVEKPEDWEFSSASWYIDGSGPLAIDAVESW